MSDDLEQVEAERLRQLRADIEALLREYDACGVVFLAGRAGRFEHFNRVEATWSNLRYVETPKGAGIGLRSRAADYGGDLERKTRDLEWSVGVVSGLAEAMGRMALPWLEAAQTIDRATGATHTPFRRDDPRDPPEGS